jgi:hypothetical protein
MTRKLLKSWKSWNLRRLRVQCELASATIAPYPVADCSAVHLVNPEGPLERPCTCFNCFGTYLERSVVPSRLQTFRRGYTNADWLLGWLRGCLLGYLLGWLGWLAARLGACVLAWLVASLLGCLVACMVGWWVGGLVAWVLGWLLRWLLG